MVEPDSLERERELHRGFVIRNIEFITEILAGENHQEGWQNPCGCPTSTPERIALKRDNSKFPCVFRLIETGETSNTCLCGDPLCGSDDPLDSVAAVILATNGRSVAERYFDHRWRETVANLRGFGTWEEISELSIAELEDVASESAPDHGISSKRVGRLSQALNRIRNHRWIDAELTLSDLPRVPYENLKEFLADLPGISESDAWWLLLNAFDKPVWPADSDMDILLYEFGLLSNEKISLETGRHSFIEEILTDRQLSYLHRVIAAHTVRGGLGRCGENCEARKFTLSYRIEKQKEDNDGPVIVDLFAGAGGFSYGFLESGFRVGLAVDNNEYAMDTYRLNHPSVPHERVLCENIQEVLEQNELSSRVKEDVDVVVGGPPCQSVSTAGYRARLSSDDDYSILDDPRTELYREYVEVIERLKPGVIVMENVDGLVNEVGDSNKRVVDDVLSELDDAGYFCDSRVVDFSEQGVPQERNRLIIIGLNKQAFSGPEEVEALYRKFKANDPGYGIELHQALSGLPRLCRGEGSDVVAAKEKTGRTSEFVMENDIAEGTNLVFNHQAREHPMDKDRELFDDVMEPGDTGWSVKYEKGRDDLIEYNVGTRDNPSFVDKYRMIDWFETAPTVVSHLAKDSNNFVIPDYYKYVQPDSDKRDDSRNRGITPREAARLQTFRDCDIFLGPFTSQFRQIGNAIPPVISEQLGKVVRQELEGRHQVKQTGATPIESSADD